MTDKTTSPPPAYFLSLSLENVRSFGEKQTISFFNSQNEIAQWTIILGDNGVGKTTLLKSLVATSPERDNNQPGFYLPRFIVNWPYIWLPTRLTGDDKMQIVNIAGVGKYLNNIHNRTESKVKWEQTLTLEKISGESSKFNRSGTILLDEVSGLICYGYGAGRTVGNSTLSDSPEAIDTCISLFDDRADLLNPEEWFLNIDYGSKLAGEDAGQLNKARTLVEEMLKKVLPGVTELRIASSGTP